MNLLNSLNVPEPTQPVKPKQRRWVFVLAALVCICALAAAGLAAYLWWGITTPMRVKDAEPMPFTIARGESLRAIAANLAHTGLIRRKEFFISYAYIYGQGARLQAGEYVLRRDLNIPEIVKLFVAGNVVPNEIVITLPEGFSAKDMDAVLAQKKLLAPGAFRAVAAEWEGYLFPDTYRFRKDVTATTVRDALLANFKKKFTDAMRQDAALQLQKTHPKDIDAKSDCSFFSDLALLSRGDAWCSGDVIVTLASLIEKEVRTQADMKMVADILWKRLQLGIPLQVDATVVYAKENPSTSLLQSSKSAQDTRRSATGEGPVKITYDDLKIDSPYNTYLHRGLPPGPIANPGLNALLAAIYPQESEFLYYLSKPTGETVFSRTLEEHNAAKAKYLK